MWSKTSVGPLVVLLVLLLAMIMVIVCSNLSGYLWYRLWKCLKVNATTLTVVTQAEIESEEQSSPFSVAPFLAHHLPASLPAHVVLIVQTVSTGYVLVLVP